MIKFNEINKLKKKTNIKNKITFSLLFVSLISPFIFNNIRLFFDSNKNYDTKLLLKQSYVLLTWFYYLNFINLKNSKKHCRFFVLPLKQNHYTILKAPMAHKTKSKEQLKFQYFLIKISFSSTFYENSFIKTVDSALIFALISKKKFLVLETNLLFLKNYTIFFYYYDNFFFNYNFFLNV